MRRAAKILEDVFSRVPRSARKQAQLSKLGIVLSPEYNDPMVTYSYQFGVHYNARGSGRHEYWVAWIGTDILTIVSEFPTDSASAREMQRESTGTIASKDTMGCSVTMEKDRFKKIVRNVQIPWLPKHERWLAGIN